MQTRKDRGRRKAGRPATPADILAAHTPDVRALAESLRKLVLEAVPNAREVAYPVWHGIGYHHPDNGYFCAVFPQADSVKLGFEFGVLLPNPGGLLTSSGKQVRYVTLREGGALPAAEIKKLLRSAIGLPNERAAKLWLIKSRSVPTKP